MKNKNKKNQGFSRINIIWSALLIIFATASFFLGAYFMAGKSGSSVTTSEGAKKSATQNNGDLNNPASADLPEYIIEKGWIKWQEPQDLGDLGFTNKNLYGGCYEECGEEFIVSGGIKYLKVGDVSEGKYKDSEVFVISSNVYEGPSLTPNIFRFLKKGNKVIFLSDPRYGLDEYLQKQVETYFSKGAFSLEFNNKLTVEELNYPEELYGLNERQRFTKDEFAQAFFTDAKLKKAFVNPKYGQVWMTDEVKSLDEKPTPFELNSYLSAHDQKKQYKDIFGRQGFYMKAPDGTAVAYKLKIDIFDKQERVGVLEVTWNDGKKNADEYEENPSGCGSGDYVYNETLKVDSGKDLVALGKTDEGDYVYGYRDTTLPEFEKLYTKIYWVKEGEQKKSREEFLKMNPKVFWKDPFGRIIAFYRADIISPAECGKPVIYLYPEKPMNISVKVRPGNGISFSDPEYGKDGWNVFADTQSNILNLKDGKTYPYLFWEGQGDVPYQIPSTGFVVAEGKLSIFLDEKLKLLGLNDKEAFDFKEFWVPKMLEERTPYYFVTFLSQRFTDLNAPLSIFPKPDTVVRVLMDYKGMDQYEQVSEPKINTPERKGFTAVEWGGMLE